MNECALLRFCITLGLLTIAVVLAFQLHFERPRAWSHPTLRERFGLQKR